MIYTILSVVFIYLGLMWFANGHVSGDDFMATLGAALLAIGIVLS